MRALTVATHDVLVRHPWAPALWLRHLPGPARTRTMEDLLRLFAASGLSPDVAHHGFHAVNNHVLGYTLQQLSYRIDADKAAIMRGRADRELTPEAYPRMAAHLRYHDELGGSAGFRDGRVHLRARPHPRRPGAPARRSLTRPRPIQVVVSRSQAEVFSSCAWIRGSSVRA